MKWTNSNSIWEWQLQAKTSTNYYWVQNDHQVDGVEKISWWWDDLDKNLKNFHPFLPQINDLSRIQANPLP